MMHQPATQTQILTCSQEHELTPHSTAAQLSSLTRNAPTRTTLQSKDHFWTLLFLMTLMAHHLLPMSASSSTTTDSVDD